MRDSIPAEAPATVHSIRIAGLTRSFACPDGERLLVAMERAQRSDFGHRWEVCLPVGCRRGGCGVCRVRVLEGRYRTAPMSETHVTEEERASGYALSCCIFAESDLLVEPAPKRRDQGSVPSKEGINDRRK